MKINSFGTHTVFTSLVFEDDFGIMVWMNVSYLDSDCLAVGCSMGFRLHNYFFNDVL